MTRGTKLILALSLFANLGLGYAYLRPRNSASGGPPGTATTHQAPAPAQSANWQSLSDATATDDPAFVAKLRAEGFPLRIQRALLQQRLRKRYADQFRALSNKDREIPYWRTESWAYNFNPETRAKRRLLEQDISNQIRQLLGVDDVREPGDPGYDDRKRLYGPIPAGKITAIEAINRDYGELSSQIREAAKGITLPEDREKLAFLEKEKRADLAQLLTPAELDEFDRRNSPAASDIRNRTRFFEPTEDEFIVLYNLQRDFDTHFGRDNLSGPDADRRRDAVETLNKQFEAALGAERYAEFQIVSDGNFYATHGFVTQFNIPTETAKSLVRVQREHNHKADSIRKNNTLTSAQKTAALAEVELSATTNVTSLIGTEHLDNYKKYSAGQWLNRLSPKAKTEAAR